MILQKPIPTERNYSLLLFYFAIITNNNIPQIFLSEGEAQQPFRGEPQSVRAADDE